MVAPILNYTLEIWGFEEWSKLETLHLKACTYALGARSSTTTDTIHPEVGRVSLQCQRHVNIFNFFAQLSSLDSQCYGTKAFCMVTIDIDDSQDNWVSHAHDLQVLYELQHSDTH